MNYKVSVFAYLSRNKRTHDILKDEDYISHILDVIKRFSLCCPPNKHYTTTANITELGDRYRFLVIFVIDLLHVIRGVIFLLLAVKNMKASVVRLARVAWRFCRAQY